MCNRLETKQNKTQGMIFKRCHLGEEELDAGLADVVSTHIDHELHVGVPVLGGLAPGAHLVHVHPDPGCCVSVTRINIQTSHSVSTVVSILSSITARQ